MTAQKAVHFESLNQGVAICGKYSIDDMRAGPDDIVVKNIASGKKQKKQRYVPSVMTEEIDEVTCKMCLKLAPNWKGVTRNVSEG